MIVTSNYKISKYLPKDKILVKNDWEENSSNLIQIASIHYKQKKNYITRVIDFNYDETKYSQHKLVKGDLVLLSRYCNTAKGHKLDSSKFSYTNLPMLMVQGVFRKGRVNLDELEMLDDKVLVEKIVDLTSNGILLPDLKEGTVGCVIKTGNGGFLKNWTRRSNKLVSVGEVILFRNNISTPVYINGREYLSIEDSNILGSFTED